MGVLNKSETKLNNTLSFFCWLISFLMIMVLFVGCDSQTYQLNESQTSTETPAQSVTSSSHESEVESSQTEEITTIPNQLISNNNFEYSVMDCYSACDKAYPIQAQVNVCQGNCEVYGKPSAALDRYVNQVKGTITKLEPSPSVDDSKTQTEISKDSSINSDNELIEKVSGFTLNECNALCDVTYDIQAQVDSCQFTCAAVGKEGPTLDKIALKIITIYKDKH